MLCLSDNDIILKLAEYDVLNEAIEILEAKRKDVYVLATAKNVFARSAQVAKCHTGDAINRAIRFIGTINTITTADPNDFALLRKVKGIDVGEATLFAATRGLDEFRLATGDKRSLSALASCNNCDEIRARLKGRVVCLEQIVAMLIHARGYQWVQKKVGRCVGDACIENAFANGRSSQTKEACLKWLDGYILDLRNATGELLLSA